MEYLSDDENNEIEEQTFDDLYPEEEMDEETRNIIFSTNQQDEDFDDLVQGKNNKGKKENNQTNNQTKKGKSVMSSFDELIKLAESKKPKKWVSTRAESKRVFNVHTPQVKRKFNPRLPPYNSIKKQRETDDNLDETSFPSL